MNNPADGEIDCRNHYALAVYNMNIDNDIRRHKRMASTSGICIYNSGVIGAV